MDFIRVTCSCGRTYKVPARLKGREGKCPACGARVRVPDSEGELFEPEVSASEAETPHQEVEETAASSQDSSPGPPPAGDRVREPEDSGPDSLVHRIRRNVEALFGRADSSKKGGKTKKPGETGADKEKATKRTVRTLQWVLIGAIVVSVVFLGWFWVKGTQAQKDYRRLMEVTRHEKNLRIVQRRYEAFLAKYPNSEYAVQVRARLKTLPKRIEEADFRALQKALEQAGASLEHQGVLLKRFLKRHPSGKHAEWARQQLKALPRKIEERDFSEMKAVVEQTGRDIKKARAAIKEFLRKYPRGTYASQARTLLRDLPKRIEDLDFQEILRVLEGEGDYQRKIEVVRAYLARYPEGRHTGEVQKRLRDLLHGKDDEDYQAALDAGKTSLEAELAAMKRYLFDHPNGLHAEEARKWIAEYPTEVAKRDKRRVAALEKAKKWRECQEVCREFIKTYPDHPAVAYFRTARIRCERLEIPEQAGGDSVSLLKAYDRFIRRYRTGPEVEKAKQERKRLVQRMDDGLWTEISTEIKRLAGNTASEQALLQQYLKAYPSGIHAREARKRLAEIKRSVRTGNERAEWRKAKARVDVAEGIEEKLDILESFIRTHPDSSFREQAQRMVISLERRRVEEGAPIPPGRIPRKVYLADGSFLEGTVGKAADGRTVVRTLDGDSYYLKPTEVVRIETTARGREMEQFNRMLAALDPNDASSYRRLAAWAKEHGFPSRALMLRRMAAYLNPEDLESVEILKEAGFRLENGRWKAAAPARP